MKYKILATCAALALAGSASAAQINFTVIEAKFGNPVGGSSLNILQIDDEFSSDPVSVYWGQAGKTAGVDASGYIFGAADPLPTDKAIDQVFGLGEFTHENYPIRLGTQISSVDFFLTALVDVVDNGETTGFGPLSFKFRVFHEETPNAADPCAYDVPENNEFGCADRVNIVTLDGSDSFNLGEFKYTLSILGFSTSLANAEAGIFSSEFFSEENGSNSRILAAAFTTVAVPAPATGLLLIGGLLMAAGLRRRKH